MQCRHGNATSCLLWPSIPIASSRSSIYRTVSFASFPFPAAWGCRNSYAFQGKQPAYGVKQPNCTYLQTKKVHGLFPSSAPATPPASPARRVETQPGYAVDQLRIAQAGLQRGLREVFILGEDRIRVGLDEIDFVLRRDAQVDARVAVDGEQVIDALAPVFDVRDEFGRESLGELVLQTPFLAVFLDRKAHV